MRHIVIEKASLDEIEKATIEERIREHADNLQAAAKSLGISRSTIYRKVKQYNIKVRNLSEVQNDSL